MNALNRTDIKVIPAATPLFPANNKARFLEDSKMLHHGGSVEMWKLAADLAGGLWRKAQKVKNLPAIGRRQRFEYQVILIDGSRGCFC
jgi:hypothetical protein